MTEAFWLIPAVIAALVVGFIIGTELTLHDINDRIKALERDIS